jgi:hypothetical protein
MDVMGIDYLVRRDIVDDTHNSDLQQYYGKNVVLERTKDGYITIYGTNPLTLKREGHEGKGSYAIIDTNKGFDQIYAFKSDFKSKENYTIVLAANANSGSDYEAHGVSVSFVKSVNGSIGFFMNDDRIPWHVYYSIKGIAANPLQLPQMQ